MNGRMCCTQWWRFLIPFISKKHKHRFDARRRNNFWRTIGLLIFTSIQKYAGNIQLRLTIVYRQGERCYQIYTGYIHLCISNLMFLLKGGSLSYKYMLTYILEFILTLWQCLNRKIFSISIVYIICTLNKGNLAAFFILSPFTIL